MIERASSPVDVDALMARLRARVDQLRQQPIAEVSMKALSVRSSVFINSIEAYANIADQKLQVRTHWPSNIGATFPFNIARIRDLSLKLLAFTFKDQRHVNAAVVSALREQISLNRHLMEQLQLLRAELDEVKASTSVNGTR